MAVCALFAQTVQAAIIVSGDVAPDPTGGFVNSSPLGIGGSGVGSLAVTHTSVLTLQRNIAQTSQLSLLRLGFQAGGQGTLDILDGGVVRIDGNDGLGLPLDQNLYAGVNIGRGGPSSSGRVNVSGAGSRLEFTGPLGFINVGVDVAGSAGRLDVTDGGVVTGIAGGDLPTLNVGRDGGSGTVNISGADASGTASLVRLAGRNALLGSGAFMNIGRNSGTGASHGTVNVASGGRLEIDTAGLNLDGQPGMWVGIGLGSTASLVIDGTSAFDGAASTVAITGGSGTGAFVGVGRDGASGEIRISDGGRLLLHSDRVAVPNASGYLPGDTMNFEMGGRSAAGLEASTGSVTVTGAGSELAMTGQSDRYMQIGRGANATGRLAIEAGGLVRGAVVLMGGGAGATGELSMDNGRLMLEGVLNGGPAAGTAAALSVGRGGGIGRVSLENGSTLGIASAAPGASLSFGGTGASTGGIGTATIGGGSVVSVDGPDALIAIGRSGSATQPGIGTVSLTDPGSSLSGSGSGARVVIGAGAHTTGTLLVGTGASVSATSIIGVGHDGLQDTGGAGTLCVNGSAHASSVIVGASGLLCGSGMVSAHVVNLGTINPGQSPGRLTIDGAFDSSDGRIVLEIEQREGSFFVDEIVFGDPLDVTFGDGTIEFSFLGATDPHAFLATGAFALDSFFKQATLSGEALGLHRPDLFADVRFQARSDAYRFESFEFDPVTGARFLTSPVPQPSSLALMLAGLFPLWAALRRHRAGAGGRAGTPPQPMA